MFAMDILFLKEYDELITLLQTIFPGEYHIIKQKNVRKYHFTPNYSAVGVGREAVGFFKGISNSNLLLDEVNMHKLLNEVCEKAQFHAQKDLFNKDEYGSSGAKVLTESHIALHYLKNEDELLIDIFTCGEEGDPKRGISVLAEILTPKQQKINHLKR